MAESKIEWTDRSDWNPIRGCTRVSEGCGSDRGGGCYAEAIAARFSDPGQAFHTFARRTPKGPRWTGKVELVEERLLLPLRWRKPAKVFASSTSDFFHEQLDRDDVAQLFGVMIAAHHLRGHVFQVLTKRSAAMRRWLNDADFWEIANAAAGAHVMERVDPLNRRSDDARAMLDDYGPDAPAPGIWLGVSVEDQARADERIPDLLATPASVRFISAEPLLGPVTLMREWRGLGHRFSAQADDPHVCCCGRADAWHVGLDWVIVGGESGPGARPMHPDWARSLRDQCQAAGVPFFFKQWGEWAQVDQFDPSSDSLYHWDDKRHGEPRFASAAIGIDGKTGPRADDLRSPTMCIHKVGKKRAGRLLDGREWNGVPGHG